MRYSQSTGANVAHQDYIRTLSCLVCSNNIETECAHVRFSDARAAKPESGMGRKPEDCWTVPLCSRHHRDQHDMGEVAFWNKHGIDPIFVCLALWRVSGNHELGEKILEANR